MTLCKDLLIGKLVALFQEADPANIDEAVTQAKRSLVDKAKRARRSELERLFDLQIATLRQRGCPEQIVEMLAGQRNDVVARASEMSFENGRVPFLPIIPRTYLRACSTSSQQQGNKG